MSNSSQDRAKDNIKDVESRHAQFVGCLEKHGPEFAGSEWHVLAEDLGWSEEEVQQYAFEYLTCLMRTKDVPTTGEEKEERSKKGRDSPDDEMMESEKPWSIAEEALFETLVATYKTSNSGPRNKAAASSWAESIAAHLPGRTAIHVKRRFQKLNGKGSTENNASTSTSRRRDLEGSSIDSRKFDSFTV